MDDQYYVHTVHALQHTLKTVPSPSVTLALLRLPTDWLDDNVPCRTLTRDSFLPSQESHLPPATCHLPSTSSHNRCYLTSTNKPPGHTYSAQCTQLRLLFEVSTCTWHRYLAGGPAVRQQRLIPSATSNSEFYFINLASPFNPRYMCVTVPLFVPALRIGTNLSDSQHHRCCPSTDHHSTLKRQPYTDFLKRQS